MSTIATVDYCVTTLTQTVVYILVNIAYSLFKHNVIEDVDSTKTLESILDSIGLA